MGAWDETALGNDAALDFKSDWDDYVQDNIKNWGSDKVYKFYKNVYFNGKIPSDDVDESNEVIALGQLFIDNELELPKELISEISIVVTLCLDPDELQEWSNASKRKRFLLKYIETIGGEVNKKLLKEAKKSEVDKYKNEIKNYKKFFENIDEIVQVRKTMKGSTFDLVNSMYPEIARELDKIYTPITPNYALTCQIEAWRTKFIAWWAGFILVLEPEEILDLIAAADRKSNS